MKSLTWAVSALCCFLLSASSCIRSQENQKKFVYREDTERRVAIKRHNVVSVGKLDSHGQFVPDVGDNTFYDPHAPFARVIEKSVYERYWTLDIINKKRGFEKLEPVYEFRAGQLILGNLDYGGDFLPVPGSKVTSFEDYLCSNGKTRIYNLPGTLARIATKENTEFKEDLLREVAFLKDGLIYFGRLKKMGEFEINKEMKPVRDPNSIEGNDFKSQSERIDNLSLLSEYVIINRPKIPDEIVYELNNGLVRKGKLRNTGEFVPDPDPDGKWMPSHLLPISTYMPRVYNLPGEFVAKE